MANLTGKVAIVMGSSHGIGRAIADMGQAARNVEVNCFEVGHG
jgi:NAD(P)-dependent dehydrogenase (short-subunit alcohol dehydrogenase family)